MLYTSHHAVEKSSLKSTTKKYVQNVNKKNIRGTLKKDSFCKKFSPHLQISFPIILTENILPVDNIFKIYVFLLAKKNKHIIHMINFYIYLFSNKYFRLFSSHTHFQITGLLW